MKDATYGKLPALASPVCSAGLVVWAAGRLWPTVHGAGWGWGAPLAAAGLMLACALLLNRWLLRILEVTGRSSPWNGPFLGLLQIGAVVALHPYVTASLLGGGDANSYAMSIADFLAQRRHGVFPVLIGQSEFAFQGAFQPLRNAPYFDHLAWLLDRLSLGTLGVFALENLTALASLSAAMTGGYAALRLLGKGEPWVAFGLALLLGFCPGLLAPLYGGDMFITFMTLPFLPWLVLGMARTAVAPTRFGPWSIQGIALAGIWLAHPPVGVWAAMLAVVAGLWVLATNRSFPALLAATAAAVFLPLAAFLLVSVAHLHLPQVPRDRALADVAYKVNLLRGCWASTFHPLSAGGNQLVGDIQLGYGLWACLLGALAGAVRSKAARPLLACFAVLLLFAWPFTRAGETAWRSLPTEILVVTNQWPMERFYVLFATVAVFVIASGSGDASAPRWARRSLMVLLPLAFLWELKEAGKFFQRGSEITFSSQASENTQRPENVVLSRTHSYEYLGTPSYYSNGHMDPGLELRLVDATTRSVFADGSTPIDAEATPDPARQDLALKARVASPLIRLEPGDRRLLRFRFADSASPGELTLMGASLSNVYTLPFSGMPRAFGSDPSASHVLLVRNTTTKPEDIVLAVNAGPSGSPAAQVSLEALDRLPRRVTLEALVPLVARVRSDRDAYLETPRLFVPGYAAQVDGAPAPVLRSGEGLVAVPVGPGDHRVRVAYDGGTWLRASYYATGACWCVLLGIGLWCAETERGAAALARWAEADAHRLWTQGRGGRHAWVAGGLVVLLLGGVALARWRPRTPAYGAVRLTLRLPWPVIGQSQPLVTTGKTGAGDFVYLTYLDGTHIAIGHDKWNVGGSRSRPIAVDYAHPQTIEVSESSLYPEAASADNGYTQDQLQTAKRRLTVTLNGKTVLSEDGEAHPSMPAEVAIGANTIGGSTTGATFTGEILKVERLPLPQ